MKGLVSVQREHTVYLEAWDTVGQVHYWPWLHRLVTKTAMSKSKIEKQDLPSPDMINSETMGL